MTSPEIAAVSVQPSKNRSGPHDDDNTKIQFMKLLLFVAAILIVLLPILTHQLVLGADTPEVGIFFE